MIDVSLLRQGFNTPEEIGISIEHYAEDLQIGDLNKVAILSAIATVETSYGEYDIPRSEPAYGPGGLYFQRSKELQSAYKQFGAPIACSYGPFQILYATAKNVGFMGHPSELYDVSISTPYVVTYLNTIYKKGAQTPEKIAQAYNAGIGSIMRDPSVQVAQYAIKLVNAYNRFCLKYPK